MLPLPLNGKSIGIILGGQVLFSDPVEANLRKTAKEIGVDEDEYVKAANNVKETGKENVQSGAEVLFIVANALVKIGYEGLLVSTVTNNLADNFSQISAFIVNVNTSVPNIF